MSDAPNYCKCVVCKGCWRVLTQCEVAQRKEVGRHRPYYIHECKECDGDNPDASGTVRT